MATKMALVVRTDLEMGRGKIASQVAHAAVAALLDSVDSAPTRDWLADGQPKVVLRAPTLDDLLRACADAEAAGLSVQRIEDAGRTQVPGGTVTCCAIGPARAADIDAITGRLQLL